MTNNIIKISLTATKNRFKKYLSVVDEYYLQIFASNKYLSAIYYLLFNGSFYREHFSVLKGRKRYYESLSNIKESSALLRRNIHRLEKGLVMRPRREIFAEKYIQETVNCYERCRLASTIDDDEMKWAQDVISEYMDVVMNTSSDVINNARERFLSLNHNDLDSHNNYIPYEMSKRVKSRVNEIDLLNLFKQRRSVRWYKDKKVPLELIQKAISMASYAPSACNRQPYMFHIITDPLKARETASIAMGTVGFSNNINALVVILGDLSLYPSERDRHVIYIDSSLAAMQLMLALEVLGLSTCPINWPGIEKLEKKMDRRLKLPNHIRPILLLSVGYGDPTGKIPYSQKKSSEVLTWNVE
ncbi:MAG: nitroreductase family protein [Candidatus Thiodiazotropha sp. (ex Troendleina suluensis)]|nr:nitroreductase family protein [Candidatus Thiodiazotropha sp. (ex Troendleina suluensis)]